MKVVMTTTRLRSSTEARKVNGREKKPNGMPHPVISGKEKFYKQDPHSTAPGGTLIEFAMITKDSEFEYIEDRYQRGFGKGEGAAKEPKRD
jgi:hypothetical protein